MHTYSDELIDELKLGLWCMQGLCTFETPDAQVFTTSVLVFTTSVLVFTTSVLVFTTS